MLTANPSDRSIQTADGFGFLRKFKFENKFVAHSLFATLSQHKIVSPNSLDEATNIEIIWVKYVANVTLPTVPAPFYFKIRLNNLQEVLLARKI